MNEKRSHPEANVARLIRASVGGGARLDGPQKTRTRGRLLAELRCRRHAAPFPDRILAFLAVVQLCAALWIGIRVNANGIKEALSVPGLFLALPVTINLAFIPIVAIVIFQRRGGHGEQA